MAYTAEKRGDNKSLDLMRTRFKRAKEVASPLYDEARNDIKFIDVPGNQWDEDLKARRGRRRCYEFPKLRGQVVGVINEGRQTRPQGKVRGMGEGDRALAELMQGICRNIEAMSNAEQAYDVAYDFAVKGGFGCWGITTDYANQDDFDLDIFIRPKRNPFSVKFDPAAIELDRRDAMFAFEEELIPKSEFERQHPNADITDFFTDKETADWCEKDQVRVAVYWWKEPVADREIWLLSSGSMVFSDEAGLTEQELQQAGITIERRRKVEGFKVYSRLTNGREWLTPKTEFPSKFIPLVPVWGNIQNVDGDDYFSGMVRFAKDGQRMHNLHRTATAEAVAKAPKAPFMTKPSWIAGHEDKWNRANVEDYPWLPISEDTPDGVFPKRVEQAEVPMALITLGNQDSEDIKAATGQYDASLGARSNETSGKAIGMRRAQGAVATFNYQDNWVAAIRYTYEILVDMIPRVIDTPRVVRILGKDGAEKWVQLYQQVPDPNDPTRTITINDPSKGKYGVEVTVGPSYATQRMEAVDLYTQLAAQVGSAVPQIAPLLAYQVIKNVDIPGSEEVDEWIRSALVKMGAIPPREGEEAPQQAPDPRMEALIRKLVAEAGLTEAKAAKTSAEAQTVIPTAQADIAKLVADTVSQQIENMAKSGQLAAMLGPPPMQQYGTPYQPAQAGFSLPAPGQEPPFPTG